ASKNHYTEAETCYLKSIEYWNQVKEYSEYKAYPYYKLAVLFKKSGNSRKSIENFLVAEDILKSARKEYRYLLGAIYSNIGSYYLQYGDPYKAISFFDKSIIILQECREGNELSYSEAILGKIQTYYYLKKYQQAIDLSTNYINSKDVINKNQFQRLIGRCLLTLDRDQQAIDIFERSLIDFDKKPEKYSEALLVTAKAYLKVGDLKKVDEYLKKSFSLLRAYKPEKDPWNIYYYELLGQLGLAEAGNVSSFEQKQTKLSEALSAYDRALSINTNGDQRGIPYLDYKGDFITPTQVKDVFIGRAHVLRAIADNYERVGETQFSREFLDLSMKTWEAAVKFLNDFRVSFLEEESKLSLTESEVNIYIEGFSSALKLYQATGKDIYFKKMLFFSESGKSSTFLASLNAIQSQNFGGVPDSLQKKEKELSIQLTTLKQMIFNEKSSSHRDTSLLKSLEDNLFDQQKQHDELMFRFERDYPDYYAFKYKQNMVSSEEIESKLKKGQALVEYFIDEPTSETDSGSVNFLFFTSQGHSVYSQKVSFEYIRNLQTLLNQLSNHDIGETNLSDFKCFVKSANYLYSKLIGPLNMNGSVSSLIIIPDEKLAYLPFDVLVKSIPDTTRISFSVPDYLVWHYDMVYSYSATLHFGFFKGKKHAPGNILAFAPDYPGEEININQAAYRKRQIEKVYLRHLPGAFDEAKFLSTYSNSLAVTGTDATESYFKKKAGEYDILHLAMHTIMNDSIPMFSKLVFTSSSDTMNDGYLNTQEIYNMKLNARLAVLSACNTGSGQMRAGEGVMSMARAFLYAGCPSIVMTLWEVEDKSSSRLMLNFYRYLFKGYTKPEALRKAKLDHLASADPLKAHPYFWMGYIVVGDPSPLKYHNVVVIGILIFGVILLVSFFVGRKALQKRKIG
ncbi:MAG TPA: CHAT domain-containing tetratricopeptide repeat protein, partial [Prolixibacteraceae bacterium]|nr:CHAT domain-containing tetratricopeptide repeat protein [Prolixibacteraceae bacterium]